MKSVDKNSFFPKIKNLGNRGRLILRKCCSFVPTALFLTVYGSLFSFSMWKHPSLNHFKTLSYIWQPLIAAAVAILAAAMGVAAIQYQIRKSELAEEGKRQRRANALLATFTLALSELLNYASECARINASLFANSTGEAIKCPDLQFPLIPSNLTKQLADLIEVCHGEHTQPLIALVRCVQIFSSRIADVQRRATGPAAILLLPINVVGRVIDAAELYARASILIGHIGRGAASSAAPITFDHVRQALLAMPTGISNFEVYQDEIKRIYVQNNNNPEWPGI